MMVSQQGDGEANNLLIAGRRSVDYSIARPTQRPRSICRLPPKPGAFSTSKPARRRPSRTSPATDQVASVAPGAARRAS